MFAWQLMNFSQMESKVLLPCAMQTQAQEDLGLGDSWLTGPLLRPLLNFHFAESLTT